MIDITNWNKVEQYILARDEPRWDRMRERFIRRAGSDKNWASCLVEHYKALGARWHHRKNQRIYRALEEWQCEDR